MDHISLLIKQYLQDKFHLSSIYREPLLNIDKISTINKSRISFFLVPLPSSFGNVMKEALFAVDQVTRYKLTYEIKSLKKDILPAIKHLISDVGHTPSKKINFDHKLIGSKVSNHLHSIGCHLEAALPRYQYQNGLVEQNW